MYLDCGRVQGRKGGRGARALNVGERVVWRGDNGCEGRARGRLIMDAGLVERATNGEGAAVEDVGVDHCRGDVAVAEELLNGADVVAGIEEVGGKAVAEGVAGGGFGEIGGFAGGVEGALKDGFVEVVASEFTAGSRSGASLEIPIARAIRARRTDTWLRSAPGSST